MTSLLTLFFMVYGEAQWYWYVAWSILSVISFLETVRNL